MLDLFEYRRQTGRCWRWLFLIICILVIGQKVAARARNPRFEVNERNLRRLLTAEEWRGLVGPEEEQTDEQDMESRISVVWPRISRRSRRSAHIDIGSRTIRLVHTNNSKSPMILKLHPLPASSVLDPGLLVLARYTNSTQQLPDRMVRREEECLFRGETASRTGGDRDQTRGTAAVSLCGGVIRGVVASNPQDYYVINPLPSRLNLRRPSRRSAPSLADTPHVLIRAQLPPQQRELECASDHHLKDTQPLISRRTYSVHHHSSRSVRTVSSGGWWRPSTSVSIRRRSGRGAATNSGGIAGGAAAATPGRPLFVELAVFVDRDLFRHMAINFPRDTEREVIRIVLAMVNAVQLLYHDPSLGRAVTFVLKRLEILHSEPTGLTRSHDIDRFLSSFCKWQRLENPAADSDPLHWDHAVLLTGLDLYVQLGGGGGKGGGGKLSSQVVGLAPVGGMCSRASSCTVNEGRHFESVYVVAHEIGHNLGMRHDGPMSDNECDPGSFIMSPTLGSGKITWSACSRRYLEAFLETEQASCLLDHSLPQQGLDHASGGLLPGERFTADQQCMLKYGGGSSHARSQPLDDVCRDLHCQRDRYTWTSHPALEGTACGTNMWCRSGRCVSRGLSAQQAGYWPERRVAGSWGDWSAFSECASSCLHGPGGLEQGSTGIEVAARRCDRPRPENGGRQCVGSDRRFRTCEASQICANVPRTSLRDFADEVCGRAKEVDPDLLGTGTQREASDPVEACSVWCYKRRGGAKNRGWTFPDGTACRTIQTVPSSRAANNVGTSSRISRRLGPPASATLRRGFCVSGKCEVFTCTPDTLFGEDPELCTGGLGGIGSRARVANSVIYNILSDPPTWGPWRPVGGSGGQCKTNCIAPGRGLRLVARECLASRSSATGCGNGGNIADHDTRSIQLCEPDDPQSCTRLKTPFEHASAICSRYRERVRRLSGIGMQISPSIEDPDRPCRVACQDEAVSHRFYLVNGEEGWFPFGTDCGRGARSRQAYCISGKCLEFGGDGTPRQQSLRLIPPGVHQLLSVRRRKRSVLPANESSLVTARLDPDTLTKIIEHLRHEERLRGGMDENLMFRHKEEPSLDFLNPIHVNNPPIHRTGEAPGNTNNGVSPLRSFSCTSWMCSALAIFSVKFVLS